MRKEMKKWMMMICLTFGFAFLFALTSQVQANAKDFVLSKDKIAKSGSYYYKYDKTGISKRKGKSGAWKQIVAEKQAFDEWNIYTFTTDGKDIYYGVTVKRAAGEDPSVYDEVHSKIYKIKTNGKGKTLIYNARHKVAVTYYAKGHVFYYSDTTGTADEWYDGVPYSLNVKTKKFYRATQELDLVTTWATGSYVNFTNFSDDDDRWDEETGAFHCLEVVQLYDIAKHKLYRYKHTEIGYKNSKYILMVTHDPMDDKNHLARGHYKIKKFTFAKGSVKAVTKEFMAKKVEKVTSKKVTYIDLNGKKKSLKLKK